MNVATALPRAGIPSWWLCLCAVFSRCQVSCFSP